MTRLEIAVAMVPAFVHKHDYSNRAEDMKSLAQYAFDMADALIAKDETDSNAAAAEKRRKLQETSRAQS